MSSPPYYPQDGYPEGIRTPSLQELQSSDALLDRLGGRAPLADDLDNKVVAAFAVYATQLDQASVPVYRTRQALQHHVGWPPHGVPATPAPAMFAADRVAYVPPTRPVPVDIVHRIAASASPPEQHEPSFDAVAQTVPATRSSRPFIFRLIPAAASFGAIAVLSMGASAVMTDGRSVNPGVLLNPVIGHVSERSPAGSSSRAQIPPSGVSDPAVATTVPQTVPVNQAGTPAQPEIGQRADTAVSSDFSRGKAEEDDVENDSDSRRNLADIYPTVPSITVPNAPVGKDIASAARKAVPTAPGAVGSASTATSATSASTAAATKTKKIPPGLAKKTKQP